MVLEQIAALTITDDIRDSVKGVYKRGVKWGCMIIVYGRKIFLRYDYRQQDDDIKVCFIGGV